MPCLRVVYIAKGRSAGKPAAPYLLFEPPLDRPTKVCSIQFVDSTNDFIANLVCFAPWGDVDFRGAKGIDLLKQGDDLKDCWL